jgi:SAM-dependent methyltransferase
MIDGSRISFVVPFRKGNGESRAIALQHCLEHLVQNVSDLDVTIVESAPESYLTGKPPVNGIHLVYLKEDVIFNLSRLRNIGAKISRRKFIWILDGDVLIDPNFPASLLRDDIVTTPYETVLHIPKSSVPALQSPFSWAINNKSTLRIHKTDAGCTALTCVIPRRLVPYIGLFDETFEGWGLEDGEYAARIFRLTVPHVLVSAVAVHMDHDLPHNADGKDENGFLIGEEAQRVVNKNYENYRALLQLSVDELRDRHGLLPMQLPPTTPVTFHCFDRPLCETIIKVLQSNKIIECLDIGCGLATYTKALRLSGIDCVGFDIAPNTLQNTQGRGFYADLRDTLPQALGKDCVMCLEVGEHIEKKFETTVFDNLQRLTKRLLILSWAVPGQVGEGHVNCQTNAYVIDKIEKRGFAHWQDASAVLRQVASWPHFKNTIMVFRK